MHKLYTHLFVILHNASRCNGEQCSTEMLTNMYHKLFYGHIIVWTTTCIQRCHFVQKQSVAQNMSNDNVISKLNGEKKNKCKRQNIQTHKNKQCCFMLFLETVW